MISHSETFRLSPPFRLLNSTPPDFTLPAVACGHCYVSRHARAFFLRSRSFHRRPRFCCLKLPQQSLLLSPQLFVQSRTTCCGAAMLSQLRKLRVPPLFKNYAGLNTAKIVRVTWLKFSSLPQIFGPMGPGHCHIFRYVTATFSQSHLHHQSPFFLGSNYSSAVFLLSRACRFCCANHGCGAAHSTGTKSA